MSQWIDCDAQLPERDVRVLLYFDMQLYKGYETGFLGAGGWQGCEGSQFYAEPTHWMPLPPPPNVPPELDPQDVRQR